MNTLNQDIQILLVEDNKADAMLTIRALKKHNLANQLVHLMDGVQALDFIFAKGEYEGRDMSYMPKVIFLDIKMPKIGGLEVLQAVKNDARTKMIPVVMMTSSQEETDIVASYNFGANSYVVKPVEFDNFSKTIADLGFFWKVINVTPAV